MKYEVFTLEKSWRDARAYCRNMGGDLATFSSYGDQTKAMSGISGSDREYWIGLTDLETEGKWKWCDGSTSSWRRWRIYSLLENLVYDDEPDGGRLQNCASILWPKARWYSDPCDKLMRFVCNVPGTNNYILTLFEPIAPHFQNLLLQQITTLLLNVVL